MNGYTDESDSTISYDSFQEVISENLSDFYYSHKPDSIIYLPHIASCVEIVRLPNTAKRTRNADNYYADFFKCGKITNSFATYLTYKETLIEYSIFIKLLYLNYIPYKSFMPTLQFHVAQCLLNSLRNQCGIIQN